MAKDEASQNERQLSAAQLETRNVFLVHWALVHHIVCAPSDMPIEEVERITNRDWPTGISSQWSFKGIKTNCNSDKGRTHYIMEC